MKYYERPQESNKNPRLTQKVRYPRICLVLITTRVCSPVKLVISVGFVLEHVCTTRRTGGGLLGAVGTVEIDRTVEIVFFSHSRVIARLLIPLELHPFLFWGTKPLDSYLLRDYFFGGDNRGRLIAAGVLVRYSRQRSLVQAYVTAPRI